MVSGPPPGGRLRFSLSTGTFYVYPLRTVFRWARAAGFDGIELVVNPEAIARGGQAVRRLAGAEGIKIFSVHPTLVPLPGWREREDGPDATIRLAQATGADIVIQHVARAESLDEGEGLRYRQRIERWQSRLAGSSLRLAIENKSIRTPRDWRYELSSLQRLRAFAEQHNLGLVLDTTHAGTAGQDLLAARRLMDGHLVNVHLSDLGGGRPLEEMALWEKSLSQHCFPGEGNLPLKELLSDLVQCGYAGPVTLEVHPVAMRLWWPPAIRRRLAQAIRWLRGGTGR